MPKTIKEINEKIKKGDIVVVTAEEIIDLVDKQGVSKTAKQVDVVTTGTFAPMCSSGIYFNIGHSKPRLKLGGGICKVNDVPAYTGFAATDVFLALHLCLMMTRVTRFILASLSMAVGMSFRN